MAVPKRKTSVSKRKQRRSHHRVSSVNLVEDKKVEEFTDELKGDNKNNNKETTK